MSHAGSLEDRVLVAAAAEDVSLPPRRGERASARIAEHTTAPLTIRDLFVDHYPSVWRLLRRLGVPHAQLDDAAQEVFLVAARRLVDIQPGRQQAFLYGVSLRVASQYTRAARTRLPTVDLSLLPMVVDRAPSPEAQLAQHQARAILDVVLDAMSEELRGVLVLFELEGMALSEIAAAYAIPHGTASSRLRRARDEFAAVAKRVRAALATREGGR